MRAFFNGRSVFLGLLACLFYSIVFTMGCATTNKNKSETTGTSQTSIDKQITHVEMSETADETHILVTGEQNLTFTAVKQPDPPVVIFYFPNTASTAKESVDLKGSSFITGIDLAELTETGHTVRLKIHTITDAPYTVNRIGNALDIVFKKADSQLQEATVEPSVNKDSEQTVSKESSALTSVAAGETRTGSLLKAIEAKNLPDSTQISIHLNGSINQYKSFTLDQPPRIVLDLPKIKSLEKNEQAIAVDSQWVKKIRYYSDAHKLRVVFETQKAFLDSFSIIPDANGLLVTVGAATSVERTIIRNIEYQDQAAGGSRVIVLTSRPAQYKMKRISPRWLRLILLNSRLPQEKILVGNLSQKGVVASIVPGDHASQSPDAYVDLRLKTTVPYLIQQDGDKLYISFEAPSTRMISDKSSKDMVDIVSKDIGNKVQKKSDIKSESTKKLKSLVKEPVYTGEKIALDFFNTDIRNVFRILADISGENFAIDRDVEGQVTLSLNKPVPWDRVLDLVLKMNQLEKEKQQGITRIAKLSTLEAEKNARIDSKRAEAKEQQARVEFLEAKRRIERLQPLETVYLQVNYADAELDVKPQIEPLLSSYYIDGHLENRGRVSIDKRNNVVIVTDVPEVIARARETVQKIDKLVPQVLIEARIVEASTDFSREIGLSWGMTTGIQANDPRAGIGPQQGFDIFGGTYGWDTAVNHPFSSGSPMEIGFNIAKIAGSPFGLNARLRALEVNGTGKIISSPKVLSRDNQKAIITQGREYPYFEESESGGTTVKFKKVELKLTVLPNITPDNRIAINLKIEKKDVLSFVGNVPILSSREAESEFLMNNGDTLVIGGIHKTTNRLSESGFPWLSKIPILGWLFKTKNKELDKEELLIFISPRILTLEQRPPVIEKALNPAG